ncbi:LysR family transcriptional regulator [Shewanella sp. C32]|uniref:LysR family transcriptional regulator n=1 Tax=Shewanella electrica TaxID=515560 RepID=A0ABT2FH37_9GAMM|nr:LysR family transcriptional regulator [Shewanella electrica]MCH1923484.1 LysR family transcriptional regulator [Shewanella electrica]MCS4555581.1 LysR family transcriptional regulator [Shewanella electrica]
MDRVTAAEVFNRICELGSLSAAARAMGMSRPMVSRYLAEMEQWSGSRLLHRSSRKLTLTAAGEQLLLQTQALQQLAEGISQTELQQSVAGTLRISCAHFTARRILNPVLNSFLTQHPALKVEVMISNQNINLVAERIDLAIRITNELDPNVIARRLGDCRSVLCASPEYVAAHGTPHTPVQLSQHNCLHYSNFTEGRWQFIDHSGAPVTVDIQGNLSVNESSILLDAVLNHAGIAILPWLDVAPYLAENRLVAILPDYQPQTLGIYGIYRSRLHQPLALKLLLEALTAFLHQ